MTPQASGQWLVTYDIADKRRLTRVFKLLTKNGVPVQYSVFIVSANRTMIGSLMAKIASLIDRKDDDVRAYHLPERRWHISLGLAILPDGVLIQEQAPGGVSGLGSSPPRKSGKPAANLLSAFNFPGHAE